MLGRRVLAALDLVPVLLDGAHRLGPDVAVLLDELGQEAARREVAGHVGLDEDLAGAAGAGADANGGDLELLGDDGGDVFRDGLEDHGEAAGVLDGEGVVEDGHGGVGRLALDAEAAEGVLALRGETDVAEDGDAGGGDAADRGRHLAAALELDALHAALLDEADSGAKGLLGGDFIAAHGHVTNLRMLAKELIKKEEVFEKKCLRKRQIVSRCIRTVKADFVARATERQCKSISSTRTSLVSSMPMATMARLSPTRTMSMPAWSATMALGKSCAVRTVMGSPFLCCDLRVLMVTFLRGLAAAAPMGEWDEQRTWWPWRRSCADVDAKEVRRKVEEAWW